MTNEGYDDHIVMIISGKTKGMQDFGYVAGLQITEANWENA